MAQENPICQLCGNVMRLNTTLWTKVPPSRCYISGQRECKPKACCGVRCAASYFVCITCKTFDSTQTKSMQGDTKILSYKTVEGKWDDIYRVNINSPEWEDKTAEFSNDSMQKHTLFSMSMVVPPECPPPSYFYSGGPKITSSTRN